MEIDAFILKQFQRFSDWCQKWFGFDNFFIARFFLVIYIILEVIYNFLMMLSVRDLPVFAVLAFPVFVATFCVIMYSLAIKYTERSSRQNPEFVNPLAGYLFLFRILKVFMLFMMSLGPIMQCMVIISGPQWENANYMDKLIVIRELSLHGHEVATFLIVFFVSCTPKPKKPSKVSELLDKATALLQGAPAAQV